MSEIWSLFLDDNRMSCVGVAGLVGVAGVGVALSRWWQSTRWVEVATVRQVWLYPLKSGRGVEVEEAQCGPRGLKVDSSRDRQFVVVNSKLEAQSARVVPRLVLISMEEAGGGKWKIMGQGMEPLTFSEPKEGDLLTISLLDIKVTGMDCGPEVGEWIKKFLGNDYKLAMHQEGDTPRRRPRPKYAKLYPRTILDSSVPCFADVTPYMLTTDPSLHDLNHRIESKDKEALDTEETVTHRNFRPNFVLDGDGLLPWDEDSWTGEIMVGTATFSYNKPCSRCNATRVNPDTGEVREEPLKTLKTFRQHDKEQVSIRRVVGDSPLFGMHYSLVDQGTVRRGDKVWVRNHTKTMYG